MTDFVQQQRDRVAILATKLYEGLVAGDNGAYLAKTGSLLRSNTLKSKETKKAFGIIVTASHRDPSWDNDQSERRFWSKKTVSEALRLMVKQKELQVPQLPGFSWSNWFKTQGDLVHGLAKKANRNQRYKPMSSADNLETLPYNPEDCVNGGLSFFNAYIIEH